MNLWPPPLPPAYLRAGFLALTAPRTLRFMAALQRPEAAQNATLRRILGRVAGSHYGHDHGLDAGDDYAAFRRKIPMVGYEDLRPRVDEQVATGAPVLSVEGPVLYERTSGSSGQPKLVPYTPGLMESFNSCFVLWAADLMAFGPRFKTGRMFFSTSPAFQRAEKTPTGVPISLTDDAAYLSSGMQRLFRSCFFIPPCLKTIQDGAAYRRSLAAVLIAQERLEILSVWSPTYLLTLLETIREERTTILDDLKRGWTGTDEINIPLAPMRPERLELLTEGQPDWTALWPHLALLSCWTDGASAAFVPALRQAFPNVMLQGKGLLATEAPITVPLVCASAPAPLLDEVFLEFEQPDGSVRRLHELEEGEEYTVLVTQAGGFLRYRQRDRVRVEGRCGATPTLRFLGREGRTSDLVGEKLGEPFVRAVLSAQLGEDGHCTYLVGQMPAQGPPDYVCVTDHPQGNNDPTALAERLDAALRAAYHYGQARKLGQLGALRVMARADSAEVYERIHLDRGMTWGQIKFEVLVEPDLSGPTSVLARP